MSEAVQPSSSDPMPGAARRGAPMNVVGVGAVTGYGWGTKHLWDGFLLGESAVKLTTGLEGFVDGGQAYLSLIADEGDRRDGPSRFMRAARAAAREAISDAMERGWKPGPVVGLVHSIEAGDIETWSKFYRSGESRVRPKTWVNMLPSTVISQLMKENDFHGPTMSVSAMCATANAAMITAKSWLDTGVASDVILLATDLCGVPQVLRGFSDLGAAILSMPAFEACRPFQEGSRGFVGGEAAVSMVMSKGSQGSYASVLGGAMTMDASNLVGVAPDLYELFRCFRLAMAQFRGCVRRRGLPQCPRARYWQGRRGRGAGPRRALPRRSRDLLGQTTGRALPVGGGRRGGPGHDLRLPDRFRACSARRWRPVIPSWSTGEPRGCRG